MSGDLSEGIDSSSGHPIVLFVLNAALSTAFAALLVWLSAFAGLTTFSWGRVVAFAAVLVVLTYVVTSE